MENNENNEELEQLEQVESEEIDVVIDTSEIVESQEEEHDENDLQDVFLENEEETIEEESDFFTYVLNANNTVFLVSTHITEKEAIAEHSDDVSVLYANHDALPESEFGVYKKIGSEFVADEEENKSLRKRSRFVLVAELFSEKNIDLKAVAIGKDEMQRDMFETKSDYVTYINEQFSSYQEQYANAKEGRYSEAENETIIAKYEFISSRIAPLNKFSNDIRSFLMSLVDEESEAFNEVFEKVKNFTISTQEVLQDATDEKIKLFKTEIGMDNGNS